MNIQSIIVNDIWYFVMNDRYYVCTCHTWNEQWIKCEKNKYIASYTGYNDTCNMSNYCWYGLFIAASGRLLLDVCGVCWGDNSDW